MKTALQLEAKSPTGHCGCAVCEAYDSGALQHVVPRLPCVPEAKAVALKTPQENMNWIVQAGHRLDECGWSILPFYEDSRALHVFSY